MMQITEIDDPRLVKGLAHPLRIQILRVLENRVASPSEIAEEKLEGGLALAREAGFEAEGRIAGGKTWRAICELADEVDATVIVLGARGLSRVRSALLGSVSSAVLAHTHRPVLLVHHPTT